MLNVDNVTFTFPSSPLLTQGGDASSGTLCYNGDNEEDERGESGGNVPWRRRCRPAGDAGSDVCECVHVRHVPLGATVEIVLLDQGNQQLVSFRAQIEARCVYSREPRQRLARPFHLPPRASPATPRHPGDALYLPSIIFFVPDNPDV